MSQVKFERREDIRVTEGGSGAGGPRNRGPPPPPPSAPPQQHEGLAHKVGEALTKGEGPNGYLAVREL